MSGHPTRRLALLGGAAALLGGCDSLDGIFGERRRPLPGERRPVLRGEPPLVADPALDPRAVQLPPAEPIADWPMAGGTSGHAMGHAAFAAQPRVAWRASVGSGSAYRRRITTGPVVSGGMVYAVDAWGSITAHTLAEGRLRWTTDGTPETQSAVALGGGAAVADGTVYVATGGAEVLALDPATGEIRWRSRLPHAARGAPTVAGGRIFVPTIDNDLVALSAEDGRRLWLHSGPNLATLPLGLPAPAVEGEVVVAGFGTGDLLALRVADGRLLWSESVGIGNPSMADILGITGLPVIDRGRVVASGVSNITIAVDLRSGRRLWERPFGGTAGVVSAGDWVFSVTREGQAVALGREDGRIRWVTELQAPPPEGTRPEPVRYGRPMIAGGRVIVPSSQGELLLLDPSGGAVSGRIDVGSPVTLPMAMAGGTLVALADDGWLLAIR